MTKKELKNIRIAKNKLSYRMQRLIRAMVAAGCSKWNWRNQWDCSSSWATELTALFADWFETPVAARCGELKQACRFAHTYSPRLTMKVPYIGWTFNADTVESIAEVIVDTAKRGSQSAVNSRVNFLSKLYTDGVYQYPTASSLFAMPPECRKMEAIRKAANEARQIVHSDDGFRDWWTEHEIAVRWQGRVIAESGCRQVGACARAHGHVWWRRFEGWDEMMAGSDWPEFVTRPEVCETYMEII